MSASSNIFAAMVKAQKAYGPALKGKKNPHFGNNYADLAACVEAVQDALNANGVAVAQVSHESADGVIIETKFLHESGEEWSGGKLFLPADKRNAQGFGSAMTYARRYSLMAACGIAPEDDDGNAGSKSEHPRSTPKTRTADEIGVLLAKCDNAAKLAEVWDMLNDAERTEYRAMFTARKEQIAQREAA